MRLVLLSFIPFLTAGLVTPGLSASESGPNTSHSYQLAADAVTAAITAYRAEDFTTFRDQMLIANTHRTDHPTYRYYLAAAFAKTNDPVNAAKALSEIAALGLNVPAETEADFAAIADDPRVQSAFARLRANLAPSGSVDVAHVIPARGGLWEGVVWDESGQRFFLSDLHHGEIYTYGADHTLTLFARLSADGFGCGGMAIDVRHQLLWVSSPALPEVASFSEKLAGKSRLLALSLTEGKLVRRVDFPAKADAPCTVVDLTVTAQGTVYAADSTSPVIWKILPTSDEPKIFVRIEQPGPRHSLQGLALSPDERWLVVADYSTGLHAVSLTGKPSARLLALPATLATALGIDGIARHGDRLVAAQNGVSPVRLLEFDLDLDPSGRTAPVVAGARVLFSGQPHAPDPTLLTVTPEAFIAIGNAGWKHFGPRGEPDELNRTLTLLRIPFDS